MKPQEHKACAGSTAASRGRRLPPTVTEGGFNSSESDSESNRPQVVTVEVYNPYTQSFPTVPTDTSIITRHNDVSRPSTSVTSPSHISQRYLEMMVDLDAIQVVSSETLNSPFDYFSNPNDTLSLIKENHKFMKTKSITRQKSKVPSQKSSHQSSRGGDAAFKILGSQDGMMTDFLYPVRDCENELPLRNLDQRVTKIKVLELPISRVMIEKAIFHVSMTNCHFCSQNIDLYLLYRIHGKSILYDKKLIASRVRPYVTPKSTIVLSHETCMGEKLTEGQNFILRIYNKRPSFCKWLKNTRGKIDAMKAIFIIVFILALVFVNFNSMSKGTAKSKLTLIIFNVIVTLVILFMIFFFIWTAMKSYAKWKRKTTQLTLIIWKPSVIRREDTTRNAV